jgi:hypothetical protein
VELSPKDKELQDLDQFVDVLLVKLSAAYDAYGIRASSPSAI